MSEQQTTEIAILKEALRIERERGNGWRDKFNADTDIIAELREKCAKIADEAVLNAERTNEIRRQILKEILDQAETMSGYELVRWLRQEVANG